MQPGGLLGQENVVPRLEGYELGVRDLRRQLLAGLERYDLVVPGVQNERRRAHSRQEMAHIELSARCEEAARNLRRGRAPAQFVEPCELLLGCAGYELCREQLTEHRVILTPAEL